MIEVKKMTLFFFFFFFFYLLVGMTTETEIGYTNIGK